MQPQNRMGLRLPWRGVLSALLVSVAVTACGGSVEAPPYPLPTEPVALPITGSPYSRACQDPMVPLTRPAPLWVARVDLLVPGDRAIRTAVARGYPGNTEATRQAEQEVRDRIDCVVQLIVNSGLVSEARLLRYGLRPGPPPPPGTAQIYVPVQEFRDSLHLRWLYRNGPEDGAPLLFQASGSSAPGVHQGRALIDHLDLLFGGWRPPYFRVPADHLAHCNRGNPCAPVWSL